MAPRLAEISYNPEEGITLRFKPKSLHLLPESTRTHLRAANKELLLALRGFIDQAIERTEKGEEPRQRARRISVQVGGSEEDKPAEPS